MFPQWSATPLPSWGIVQLGAFALMLASVVLGALAGSRYRYRDHSDSIIKGLFFYGIFLALIEIAKEAYMTAASDFFDVYFLPFQICSTPMYPLLLLPLIRSDKVKSAFIDYLCFFGLFGAVAYFFRPETLLNQPYIFISIHGVIWHCTMAAVCAFCMASFGLVGRKALPAYLKGLAIFSCATVIAAALNMSFNAAMPGQPTNFFYINLQKEVFYPVLNWVFDAPRPYVLFLLAFIALVGFGGLLMYAIGTLTAYISTRKKSASMV